MHYVRTTDATTEPITATELKAHLRIDHTDEDTMISSMITAARQIAEEYCQRTFITSTWKLYLNSFNQNTDTIELPMGQVLSVVGIDYAVSAAHDTEWDSANYYTGLETDIGLIVAKDGWPDNEDEIPNGIEIEYTAGYGALASNVPQAIKSAILIIAADLYEHRETFEQVKTRPVMYGPYRQAWMFMLDPYVIYR